MWYLVDGWVIKNAVYNVLKMRSILAGINMTLLYKLTVYFVNFVYVYVTPL